MVPPRSSAGIVGGAADGALWVPYFRFGPVPGPHMPARLLGQDGLWKPGMTWVLAPNLCLSPSSFDASLCKMELIPPL